MIVGRVYSVQAKRGLLCNYPQNWHGKYRMGSLLQSAFIRGTAVLWGFMLSACSAYEFSVNERVVFTPEPLFSDFVLADDALSACVKEHIQLGGIRSASQLTDLNCSQGGIKNLEGIQVFNSLKGLKLSHNQITQLGPLASLVQLAELYLDHNSIEDTSALHELTELKILNVSGNATLDCAAVPQQLRDTEFDLPKHCR